jgi:hypothetical protein
MANQPSGEWGRTFPDQAMTLAAIDRLVHHATILEMNVDSYRRKAAVEKARGPGRPPTRATIKGSDHPDCRSRDNQMTHHEKIACVIRDNLDESAATIRMAILAAAGRT